MAGLVATHTALGVGSWLFLCVPDPRSGMTGLAYAIVAVVALQRLVELWYAQRNTKALLARGAVEIGQRHYKLIVLLHAAWLLTVLLALHDPVSIDWPWIVLFGLLQLARVWIIRTLG